MNWKDIKISDILTNKKIYTPKQLTKDKEFILNLSKRVKIKSINIYYKVNANGNNILLDLILDKYISPVFYVRMLKYREDEKQKYIPSDTLKKVDRITEQLTELIGGVKKKE